VVIEADPGPFVSIGRVVIAGLKVTDRRVVERVLVRARVQPGEPYSKDAIVLAQQLLYELGLFRRVEFVPLPGQEHRTTHGLVVSCDEGRQRSYLVGVGWDTVEHARLTLGWTHLNLFGGAHALSLEARVSDRQLRYQASLRESWLPRLNMPGYMVVYSTEEEFATYSQERQGLWFEIGDRRARPFRHWYRWEYQLVEPDAPEEVLSDLEREEQRIKVASITPAVEWDARDDPLNPRRGWFASASLEYAFELFEAEAEFLKAQTSLSFYRPAGRGRLAFGLRLGAIQPLGPDSGEEDNLQVPVGTRFFAGGQVTHRAFEIDTLGILGETLSDDGDPIGGNGLLLLNVEYQRSIAGPLSAALFVDGGNVWVSPSAMRWRQMRWGVGLGLRYVTPAGPLRLEYGRKLDAEPHESSGEVFLSFGAPF
jgi:outer membrane protein insertion porin family